MLVVAPIDTNSEIQTDINFELEAAYIVRPSAALPKIG
jgi:hypothetical protein